MKIKPHAFSQLTTSLAVLVSLVLLPQTYSASTQSVPLNEHDSGELGFEVAWSPGSDLIAAATSDGVGIYTPDLQEVDTLVGHEDSVIALAWKPDGTQLAAAGVRYGTIQVWDRDVKTNTFSLLTTISNLYDQQYANKIAWSPDGDYLAVLGDGQPEGFDGFLGTVEIFETKTWLSAQLIREHLIWPPPILTWSPDSTFIAVGDNGCVPGNRNQLCANRPIVYLTSALTDYRQTTLELPWIDPPRALSWSRNGELAVTTASEVIVYDVETGNIKNRWEVDATSAVKWDDEGKYLAIAGWGGSITVIEPVTGSRVFNIESEIQAEEEERIVSVDWSPDGGLLATITKSGTIQIWDMHHLSPVGDSPSSD